MLLSYNVLMSKYKYYFRKPRSEIVKDILSWLLIGGAIFIAATSPYFIRNVSKSFKNAKKYNKKNVYNAFYRLRREGCINFTKVNNQLYISLTDKGKKKAGWLQINSLRVKKPKKWDEKWRMVIFDIAELKKTYREAFRGKLKELGFYPLQKSVWVHPFDCSDEIELLKDFFGLSEDEMILITTERITQDNLLKKFFSLK